MTRLNVKDAKTVFPDNPNMQGLAQAVMRDDGSALEAGLKKNPSAANEVGVENVGLLMLAVVNSKPNAVRALMRAGADPHRPASTISNLGRPAGIALLIQTAPDIFSTMLEEGLDINGGREGEGELLVVTAIMESDDRRLRQMLATGKLNLNIANRVQSTPFMYAIKSNQYAKALLVLDGGADPTLGRVNPLEELVQRHDNWAPGTPSDLARKQLIQRLRAMGMTESSVMRPAPVRPSSTPLQRP